MLSLERDTNLREGAKCYYCVTSDYGMFCYFGVKYIFSLLFHFRLFLTDYAPKRKESGNFPLLCYED